MNRQLTAIIEREGDGYVALCPELDIASQGETIDEARDNLKEALELFFETAPASEVEERSGPFATADRYAEVHHPAVGSAESIVRIGSDPYPQSTKGL